MSTIPGHPTFFRPKKRGLWVASAPSVVSIMVIDTYDARKTQRPRLDGSRFP